MRFVDYPAVLDEVHIIMDGQTLLHLYRQMYLVRRFEEAAAEQYTKRNIGGFLHLAIGQEAVGAGVMAALRDEDTIYTSYRDHGHYLFRGGSAREAMAELFGKETGCSKGRGGSMHFFDVARNFMGGHGIVGAHVPLAAGAAFATRYRGEKAVTVCFLGDGAVSIGPFHEGMCLAALWKLPVVFIVENNRYAMGTPLKRTMVTEDSSIRALGYPMARASVEGSDVVECHAAAKQAIDRAREESLPTLQSPDLRVRQRIVAPRRRAEGPLLHHRPPDHGCQRFSSWCGPSVPSRQSSHLLDSSASHGGASAAVRDDLAGYFLLSCASGTRDRPSHLQD